jgi:hypothetical protein
MAKPTDCARASALAKALAKLVMMVLRKMGKSARQRIESEPAGPSGKISSILKGL